jgi:DNA-binding transcriptional ArsR family regulator
MTGPAKTSSPAILWDSGTAYEFFVSLHVLLTPDFYGIRPSWAAGVRSRIPAAERKFLDEIIHFFGMPLSWVMTLPGTKDALSVLWALRQIPAEKRLAALMDVESWVHAEPRDTFLRLAAAGSWDKSDLAALQAAMAKEMPGHKEDEKFLTQFLDWWVRPREAGEMLLSALQAYYAAFFEEEEKRVGPVLQAGLEHARELAGCMSLPELLVELSQGVHFEDVTAQELLMVPAYWTTPLVILEKISPARQLFLFGARPASMSALPGELVPEGLLRSLKALADPTRLKILYYISQEDVTPSQLARRLHLRAPTVTHHLNELRLAGLVNLTFRGQEKLYRARLEAIESTHAGLNEFLHAAGEKGEK